jgi:hypothetical protein
MPSLFTITSVSNSVILDAARQGQATFTVSNTSGKHVRGRARLTPQNPETAAWLSIVGIAERDFPIDTTQQFTVKVKVPSQAPAGSYIFRLDVVGVDNPDEDYTQGPGMTFEVPKFLPKKFPWWILAVVGGVVVIAAAVIVVLSIIGQKVQVPDITGLSQGTAENELQRIGLKPGNVSQENSNTVPGGAVIRSEPSGGEKVGKGESVNLILSLGPAATSTFTPTATLPSSTPTFTLTFTSTFTRIFTPTWTFTLPPTRTLVPTRTPTRTKVPTPTYDPNVVAWYPLHSDLLDLTHHNGPVIVHNAPFQDGGVYCNGVYQNCDITTPSLATFDFGKFSIQVIFKPGEKKLMPVFMGGPSYRWIGYYLYANGHVALKYNNDQYLDCGQSYSPGTWYTARITYDGVNAKLYLNGVLACTKNVGLVHNNERVITISDFSNGTTFKGVVRDLVVKKVLTP